MNYTEIQPIALAILTSIITGGFVLVFVEIGNRKQREIERFDQKLTPFMHKLSAYFRFINWCSHRIIYPKPTKGYDKSFKSIVDFLGGYGGRIITSGGDYQIGDFNAEELEDIALKINNIWYYHDKMNPCTLTWEARGRNEDFIDKELREINSQYYGIQHDVNMVAKVSGDFYVDIYQPIEYETYRHEAFVKQYKRNTIAVAGAFLFVLAVLCAMLYWKIPVLLLQILTTLVIFLLILSLVLLAVDTMTQIKWWNSMVDLKNGTNMKKRVNQKIEVIKRKIKYFVTKVNDYIISGLVIIGLIFSAWAIFSIEIPLIPRIPSCFSVRTIEGLDRLFLALAYSYVAGAILYWFTSVIPYKNRAHRFKYVIIEKIKTIGTKLDTMNFEFRDPGLHPPLSDLDSVMAMFTPDKWRQNSTLPIHQHKTTLEAFYGDFMELKSLISKLINDYKDYLTPKQINLLEKLRESNIETFLSLAVNNTSNTDALFTNHIQPRYREMLENYIKLYKTIL